MAPKSIPKILNNRLGKMISEHVITKVLTPKKSTSVCFLYSKC